MKSDVYTVQLSDALGELAPARNVKTPAIGSTNCAIGAVVCLDGGSRKGELIFFVQRLTRLTFGAECNLSVRQWPFGTTLQLDRGTAQLNCIDLPLGAAMLLVHGDFLAVADCRFKFVRKDLGTLSVDERCPLEREFAPTTLIELLDSFGHVDDRPVAVLDGNDARRVSLRRVLGRVNSQSTGFDRVSALLRAIESSRQFSMFVIAIDALPAEDSVHIVKLLSAISRFPTLLLLGVSQVELVKLVMHNPRADFLLAPFEPEDLHKRLEILRLSTAC